MSVSSSHRRNWVYTRIEEGADQGVMKTHDLRSRSSFSDRLIDKATQGKQCVGIEYPNDHGMLNQHKGLERLLQRVVSRRGGLERAIPVLLRVM